MKIKNTFIILFSSVILAAGGLLFDYFQNSRVVSVSLYTVKSYHLQEKFSLKGEVYQNNNVNYVKSRVKKSFGIKEGAYSGIYLDGIYYDGYLKELEISDEGVATACVSIVSPEELSGEAEATVYGKTKEDIIMIPDKYIFTDEEGKESVMIARDGYCVKRNIIPGDTENSMGIQIEEGLMEGEKIVINHEDVKTGDKYEIIP